MSLPLFDFTTSDFSLCSVNVKINDSTIVIGVCVIDSSSQTIKVTKFIDSPFYTTLESLLKQLIPQHEEVKYFFYANLPSLSIKNKIDYIIKQLACVDENHIEVNNKAFNEKIFNLWSNLKILFKDEDKEKNSVIFNSEEFIFPLEVLYYTVNYVKLLNHEAFQNFFTLEKLNNKEYMMFDISCVKCLNLFDNFEERKHFLNSSTLQKLAKNSLNSNSLSNNSKTSVFGILNQCCTKFGARTLRTWLMQPLQDKEKIEKRLNIVEALTSQVSFNVEMRNGYLSKIDDIQSINMKIARYLNRTLNSMSKSPLKLVDCAKLQRCIGVCKELYSYLRNYDGVNKEIFFDEYINPVVNILKYLSKLEELISKTVIYDQTTKDYCIEPSLNEDLQRLKNSIDTKYNKIIEIKNEIEDEINSGARKYKKVKLQEYLNAGYIFEMGKTEGEELLKNNKSYKHVSTNKRSIMITTPKVSSLSSDIKDLRNEFKSAESEYMKKVLDVIATYHPLIDNLIAILSSLDILSSFAVLVSNSKYDYTKPIISPPRNKLVLKDSRHILLEFINSRTPLVSNDVTLVPDTDNIHLITGINMGGKSTYLRQVGICVVLAHIGCYVPASYAEIPIIDQIFTRVGAGDLMLKGISTYMNEMIEVCSLIKSATDRSLLLIDELGRGTSTDDGVGISYAILYHLSKVINAYCLFATHFYELTEMENEVPNVKNYYMSYCVMNGEVVMEYKVLRGKNNSSFGVGMFHSLNFDNDTCETLNKFLLEENEKENIE